MLKKTFLALAFGGIFLLISACQEVLSEQVIVDIAPGSSARSIAAELKEQGIINRKGPFLSYIKQEDLSLSLKSGRFVLETDMTLDQIVEALTGSSGELALTFLEGWTVEEMDNHLADLHMIQGGEFKAAADGMEGTLFPDTYFANPSNFSVEELVSRMKANFDAKWTPEMETALANSGRTLEEIVIVASMIEEEVRTEGDAPIVAGIIWKRLDEDWYLGIDATLLYEAEDRHLSASDLEEDSPYNTRNRKGLPPTAISNPGLISLKAALFPEESPYYFYLTTSDTGEVIYGRNLEEHATNKAKYL